MTTIMYVIRRRPGWHPFNDAAKHLSRQVRDLREVKVPMFQQIWPADHLSDVLGQAESCFGLFELAQPRLISDDY